jgi:hypothetical protein
VGDSHRSEQTTRDIFGEFESRNTYNYLQLCYYQVRETLVFTTHLSTATPIPQLKEIGKAASAAYTHLSYNPDSEVMQSNLRYYLAAGKGQGVHAEGLVNLEQEVLISVSRKQCKHKSYNTVTKCSYSKLMSI